ncbi:MAG: hypothetical protein P1Q69_10955 [Candidatus Thorarchaeota archaeon]|nr:hypothetical protein [Candidatus Thorarchaeota archaeon]
MKRQRALTFIAFMIFVFAFGALCVPEVTAAPIEDGGSVNDNDIANPSFEGGSTSSWSIYPLSIGTPSSTADKSYDGSYSLEVTGVALLSFATFDMTQTTSEAVTEDTKLGFAVYLDSNAPSRLAGVYLHIAPADIILGYYVSKTTDFPNIFNIHFLK